MSGPERDGAAAAAGAVVVSDGQAGGGKGGSGGGGGVGASESGGGGGGGGEDGDDELEAILGALLAVIRGASASNREAALTALGSKVLPRLGGASAGGREWLGELITDEDLLVAAIEDRSSRGAACHQRALGLTYQLLASSPELMSLALEPGCPLLPAVLDALGDGDGGETPSSRVAGGGAGAAAAGVDSSGSSDHHRRIMSATPKGGEGGGVAPGTPRSAPRTPRLTGMAGDGRRASRGGAADNEAAGRSGLAVLRIVGLVRRARPNYLDGARCVCACGLELCAFFFYFGSPGVSWLWVPVSRLVCPVGGACLLIAGLIVRGTIRDGGRFCISAILPSVSTMVFPQPYLSCNRRVSPF